MDEIGARPTDRDLVIRYKAGDEAAYDAIYNRHRDRVTAICTRFLRDPQDAEEAVQETFMKAYQALGRFNGAYQLGAWLARIATNVSLDHLRARRRGFEVVSLGDAHETPETDIGPEEAVVGSHPMVAEAIASLSPMHATALKLRSIAGLSHKEMAGELEMTPKQVKALLYRARSSFKKVWDRAEAMALAPLFALRRLTGRNDLVTEAGGPAWGIAGERIAAGALIAAVALTTIPSPHSPDDGSSRHVRPAPDRIATRLSEDPRIADAGREGPDAATASAEAPRESGDELASLVEPATSIADETSQTQPGSTTPGGKSTGKEAERLYRKVQRKAAEIEEAVLP